MNNSLLLIIEESYLQTFLHSLVVKVLFDDSPLEYLHYSIPDDMKNDFLYDNYQYMNEYDSSLASETEYDSHDKKKPA